MPEPPDPARRFPPLSWFPGFNTVPMIVDDWRMSRPEILDPLRMRIPSTADEPSIADPFSRDPATSPNVDPLEPEAMRPPRIDDGATDSALADEDGLIPTPIILDGAISVALSG